MKKTTILGILFLIIGVAIGVKYSSAKKVLENVFLNDKTYYFLQEGVYSSDVILKENTEDLDVKLIELIDGKYYVYLGITKDENNAKKIKDIYAEQGYNIYIKEQTLSNEEFANNLTQFDLLLNNTTSTNEILTITEVILANYEEIIKNK